MSERSVKITERCFGPVILTERTVTIRKRRLTSPVHLCERSVSIPERKLSGPVHIIGSEFAVLPMEDIIFYDYGISINPILLKVIVSWKTNVATKGRGRWRLRGSGDPWTYSILSLTYTIAHSVNAMIVAPNTFWEFQAYGMTESRRYSEWDVLKYIKISEAGVPTFDV